MGRGLSLLALCPSEALREVVLLCVVRYSLQSGQKQIQRSQKGQDTSSQISFEGCHEQQPKGAQCSQDINLIPCLRKNVIKHLGLCKKKKKNFCFLKKKKKKKKKKS